MNKMLTIPSNSIRSRAPATATRASKPSLRSHLATIAAVLVTAVLLTSALWVFILFHAQNTPTGKSTQTGDTPATAVQAAISSAKLRCSVTVSSDITLLFGSNPVDWSANGVLAASFPFQQTYAAQNCAPAGIKWQPQSATPIWSPDGTRLLLLSGDKPQVLDARTNRVLTSFQLSPGHSFSQAAWSSDSTRIFSLDETVQGHYDSSGMVQIWNASTGALIRRAFTLPSFPIGSAWISPNGAYFAMQGNDHRITFWNIATGKLVSTTASVDGNAGPVAWSPDNAALAIGLSAANWPAEPVTVQIWSSATGQLISTFTDNTSFEGTMGGLAWSPNGRYLAESSQEIHIWDIHTHRLVTTFGNTASKDTSAVFLINTLAWAPDSRGLASVTIHLVNGQQDTLNVWQFS